ncbi:MAG: fatty acid desaturase [Bacteroidota bacterium]|nr:fatty acid desaturase [Bacteroidota bacterium]
MEIALTDPTYKKKERLNFFENFVLRYINDKRDLPFIYLSIKISFTVIPVALLLFFIPGIHWLFYVAYLTGYVFFLGPYILMLHNTCHRKLFKKRYSFLAKYIHWFLGIFFGQTPETYFHHHIAMHHTENNLEEDLSSTMKYQRDSIRSFLNYLFHFYFFGVIHLSFYFSKKNRDKFAYKVLAGETFYTLLIVLLCVYNLKATLAVFILPLVFTRFSMMAGNWAQHAFIDAEQPGNIYTNSITCINTVYNKKCFNDGYHIGHHLRSSLHWTEMPVNFLDNIEKYKANKAIVFTGLDYFQIWFLLMTKNYNYLSKKFILLSGQPASADEVEAFLRSRTKRILQ